MSESDVACDDGTDATAGPLGALCPPAKGARTSAMMLRPGPLRLARCDSSVILRQVRPECAVPGREVADVKAMASRGLASSRSREAPNRAESTDCVSSWAAVWGAPSSAAWWWWWWWRMLGWAAHERPGTARLPGAKRASFCSGGGTPRPLSGVGRARLRCSLVTPAWSP